MVNQIKAKMQKSRLRWYGHIVRSEDSYVGKRMMRMQTEAKEREEDRRVDGGRTDLGEL